MSSHPHYATKPKTKLTVHQMNVLAVIIAGNPGSEGTADFEADLDQVLERIERRTSKASLQFTIRALVVNGMIEKLEPLERRGRIRAVFKPTAVGLGVGGTRKVIPAYLEAEGEDFGIPELQ